MRLGIQLDAIIPETVADKQIPVVIVIDAVESIEDVVPFRRLDGNRVDMTPGQVDRQVVPVPGGVRWGARSACE